MASKRYAYVEKEHCVACGTCTKFCPISAIYVWKGVVAKVDDKQCIGCGKCVRECPSGTILLKDREGN